MNDRVKLIGMLSYRVATLACLATIAWELSAGHAQVRIAQDQRDSLAVRVRSLPSVDVSSVPSIKIDSTSRVTVANMPDLAFERFDVNVKSLPAVEVSYLPEVRVDNLPNWDLETFRVQVTNWPIGWP